MTWPVLLAQLENVQQHIDEQGLDGWLLYDFRASNSPMHSLLDLSHVRALTRRLFYWVPRKGPPVLIRHAVEASSVQHIEELHRMLHAPVVIYSSRHQLQEALQNTLTKTCKIAMEVSPGAQLPYLSCVDVGTASLIEQIGPKIFSSAPILAQILARWDRAALDTHLNAARALEEETLQAFAYVHQSLKIGHRLNEWQLQQWLKDRLQARSMRVDHAPTVAVGRHSSDPHYSPAQNNSWQIEQEQVLLIDAWCCQDLPHARYADICRMAFTGAKVPAKPQKALELVSQAQLTAFQYVEGELAGGRQIQGWQVDAAARAIIDDAGLGANFTHRLGHSIDIQDHGSGTHMDNFETQDVRPVLSRTCFSIEPGIYFPGEFGVRLESDVYIDSSSKPHMTGGCQRDWYLLDPSVPLSLSPATSPKSLWL